ncbi:MAG: phosphotransferase family protein [Thermomicrobiales bacterium]
MRYSITDATIRAIWEAQGFGAPRQIAGAASGVSNQCFIVDDARVIRFNTIDTTVPKFDNERVAYELLAGRGLPVPSVVALDTSRRLCPYEYIILTRLPGKNLAESWRTLPPVRVRALAREAGVALARMHAITLPAFGKLREQDAPRFHSWPDYFGDYARRYIDAAARDGLLDDALRARLEGALHRAGGLLTRVTQGVLVHSDYHYENILHDGGRLSGILDFEWALSGDPSYDFMNADVRASQIPASEAAFVAGYQSIRPLDAEHDRRINLYRLFLRLETAAMHAQRGNTQAAQSARAETIALLEATEG